MWLAACQFDIAWEDPAANFAEVRQRVAGARLDAGTVLFLPEMFATGFSMNVAAIADDGQTERFLRDLAREQGISVVGGLVRRQSDGRGLNQLIGFDPAGNALVQYTKIHPFSFGDEARHFAGGESTAHFDVGGARIAPLICYDLRFPEVFRYEARRGASVFAVIANWPAAREQHWVTLLRARAIENQAYVVGVNRIGRDPKVAYSGRSMIVDPQGGIVVDATDRACIIGARLDLGALTAWRQQFPALADMREAFTR